MAEEEPEGSSVAGAAVLVAFAALVLGIVYAVSPDWFTLGVVGTVWGLIIWIARHPLPDTPNPAPPPAPEGAAEEKPQFTQDPANPHHWIANNDRDTK